MMKLIGASFRATGRETAKQIVPFERKLGTMPDDLFHVLTRFHREVVAPDLERRDERLAKVEQKLDEMLGHFDAIYRRLELLSTEYHALVAAVGRLEKPIEAIARVDVRRELEEMKARVAQLQERIDKLESTL
jgi:DNA repair exonuclease SbcCD ATPase subunit